MTHVGQQLVDELISYGVTHVFGCPGGQTMPLYNGIARRPGQIAHVLMHDERSAVYAADGYARASGRLGVCDATVGPGASNLVSGLVEAYSSSIPVLAIVSDIQRDWEHFRDLGSASQAFRQHRFLEGCVKFLGRVEQPANLVPMLQAGLRAATSGRPGPVVLEIPDDVFGAPAPERGAVTPRAADGFLRLRPGADPTAVAAAAATIRAATRPVVIAGGGALYAGAGPAVVALAEALRSPVATTISGKGVIDERHDLAVGVVGTFGLPLANSVVAQADCVIFIGSKAGQGTTLGYQLPRPGVPVVHIDIDPTEIGRGFPAAVGVYADARLGTVALTEALRDAPATTWDLAEIAVLRSQWWDGPVVYDEEPVAGVVKPQDVVRAMSAQMGEADTFVADASLSSGWGATRWPVREAGARFFAPRGLAGLGWSLPAAIGVAAARSAGSARVVSLAGDGGWSYSLGEVETAARMGSGTVSVILNNSTLGWIRQGAASRYPGEMVSQDFLAVSYADAAAALGAATCAAEDLAAFRSAFGQALADRSGRPWVIEVRSCAVESPVQQMPDGARAPGGY